MSDNTTKSEIPKALLRGVLVGLLLAAAIITFDLIHFLSRASIFEKIVLNMPEAQAWDILRSNEIACPDAWISYRCTFDDYWRTYTIVFSQSEPNHPVSEKPVGYKMHKASVVSRVLGGWGT